MRINLTSVMVDDQAKALRFYTEILGFEKQVEIPLGEAPGVTASVRPIGNPKLSRAFELTVTNDQSAPVRFEASLAGGEVSRSSARLGRRDGRPLWSVTVPANGRAVLTYTLAPAA